MATLLVELFVRGLILCLLATILLRMLSRAAAAYRHLVCVLALCGLLTLPLAQRLMPPLRLLSSPPVSFPVRPTVSTSDIGHLSASGSVLEAPVSPNVPPEQTVSITALAATPVVSQRSLLNLYSELAQSRKTDEVLLAVWGIGTGILSIRLLVALLRLRRLTMGSRRETAGAVPVLVSTSIQSPLTWGLGERKSVILLPAVLLSGDVAVCESAVRHEQAHIRRRDWLWSLLAEIVCALCWFQPGVWWLRSRMRWESERACDDLVLLSGVAGPDYATHLLQIVQSVQSSVRSGTRSYGVAPTMAQNGGKSMEKRMAHILDTKRPRRSRSIGLASVALLGAMLLPLAALRVSARPSATAHRAPATPPSDAPHVRQNVLAPVVWGTSSDGLQPGILLTSPVPTGTVRVPLNSQVHYKLLVRNTTRKERTFVMQCLDTDDWEIPYLIPGNEVAKTLKGATIPDKFKAKWANSPFLGLFPAYVLTLLPGETVFVPGEFGLYLGNDNARSFPRIETPAPGTNWIVQPITIDPMTESERKQLTTTVKQPVTLVDRKGQPREATCLTVGAQKKLSIKLLAKMPITIFSTASHKEESAVGKDG